MPLAQGTRIGPHEITALLGVGGMGEVYRARDTALGREVAIKVLPDAFAQDPDRLARFEREARTLATLNHPHIAQVYGFERSPAVSALVMELVEGPTLADRIGTGPVPLDEAMAIATQVAEALEAAHEQGIIHRDLKPANIKVRGDGVVKVLDFGLAKLAGRDGPGSNPALAGVSQAATVTSPVVMTGVGMILGTAAYMAPEQARGRAVDKRADVWAFGCVLYEMLTGQRAFRGEDITETLASVVRDQPDLASIPEGARGLIARCLEKDPKARLRDLGDRSLLLDTRLEPASSRASQAQWAWPAATVVAFALAGLALWAPWREAPLPADEVTFEITPPPGASFAGQSNMAVSPDGRSVAFKAISQDRIGHVWIRSVGSASARMLGATAATQELGSDGLVWSPDSRSLAFNHGGDIRRIDVVSGEVRTVCDGCGRASSWNEDGTILTWGDRGPGIMRVPAIGGAPAIASTPATESSHRHPAFLPDGRNFVFYRAGQDDSDGIYLGSLDRPADMQESRRLVALQAATNLAYAPALTERFGGVLYMDGDKLMALPFDHARMAVAGEPLLVEDGVGRGGAGYGFFSMSPAGVLVYRRGSDDRTLTWFDRAGTVLGAAGPVQGDVSLSGDGLWAAVAARASGLELLDLRRGLRTRIADGLARNGVWSPDGARVAFSSSVDSKIWVSSSNGGRPKEAIFEGVGGVVPNDWSPDGRVLLYSASTTPVNSDIWVLPIDGDRRPRSVVRTPFNEARAQFSPDGRWVAYESNESSVESQVFVTPFSIDDAKTTQRWTIAGGREPRWRADGKELYYRNAEDLSMMAVDVSSGPPFKAGTPRRLFLPATGPAPGPISNAYYDVTPDGQRFLVNTFAAATLAAPITVRLNWRPDRTR